MQAQSGVVIPLVLPQPLPTPTGYHDNQIQTNPGDAIATVSVATQIEEAHSTTNNVTSCAGHVDGEGDGDKKAIYRHPLFPLMALLLEKCEQATQTPDCPSSDSFDVDIQAFVQRQEQERRPFFSEDLELDGLMVKAIQVLRIHLLELEKVNELCKDFCNRYISCLKGKLQSENLLRSEFPGFDGENDDCLLSPGRSSVVNGNNNNNNNAQLMQNSNMNVVLHGSVPTPAPQVPVGGLAQGQVVSGGTVYQMVQTPQGLVAQPIQVPIQSPPPAGPAPPPGVTTVIHGSTPMSQIGLQALQDGPLQQQSPNAITLPKDFNFDDDDGSSRKNKRGILPKQATQVMKSWLFQHIVHPYPTEDEKRQIAGQTNLTMLQVNNWFINARRRILQPMLDASNPEGPKTKKSKPQQTRPVQRFWPENLANLQPQSGGSPTNQLPDSPSSSQSQCGSSPQLTLQVSVEESEALDEEDPGDEEEDDEEQGGNVESYSNQLSGSNPMATSHPQAILGHQVLLQNSGTVQNLVTSNMQPQPATLVSSTSATATTLNLIADAAVGHIHQTTNFLPYFSTQQTSSNLVSVMATPVSTNQSEAASLAVQGAGPIVEEEGPKSDLHPEVTEASSMTQ